jgi:NAD(P)-dependent dehydrogenase (short-subunit alcohol dehydrogenase family)
MKRVALVIGGGSGLGRASAIAAAQSGLSVAVADLSLKAATAVTKQLPGEGHAAFAVDVSNELAVVQLFASVSERSGPVAVLQNFAGIILWPPGGSRPAIVDTTIEEWDRTFEVNSRGAFLCVREMLRQCARTPVAHGRIILISSSAAQIGGYNSPSPYIASKGAILSLTKAAAREAAPLGVTVNCIAPGAIDTPMLRSVMPRELDPAYSEKVPLGRIGDAMDVASAAQFLSSPSAGYITGACLDVNGGIQMR